MYNSSFFGFYDPDGRPWGKSFQDYMDYQSSIEESLKIALLTQFQLPIPAGYFLDNLAIQRIFMKYSGNAKEAICFRELIKNCVVIAANESDVHTDTISDWNGIMNEWAIGSGSNRNRFAYPNCLPHVAAESVQNSVDGIAYCKSFFQSMSSVNRIDYDIYLNNLNHLDLKMKKLNTFDFDSIIREKLFTGNEKFESINEGLSSKLKKLAKKTKKANIRFSRSLIQNKNMCLEVGLHENDVLNRKDYETIAPILAHYHHYAFAKSLDMDSYVTQASPNITFNNKFNNNIDLIGNELAQKPDRCNVFSLDKISFEDIYKVRLGKDDHQFMDNLQMIHMSISSGTAEDFTERNKKHYEHIKKIITHSQYDVPLKHIEASIKGTVFVGEPDPTAMLALAKGSWAFFKELKPNRNRRKQIDSFFRAIDIPNK